MAKRNPIIAAVRAEVAKGQADQLQAFKETRDALADAVRQLVDLYVRTHETPPAPPPESAARFTLTLCGWATNRPGAIIETIKEIRNHCQIPLKDAKDLTDKLLGPTANPTVILQRAPARQVHALAIAFNSIGAQYEITPS